MTTACRCGAAVLPHVWARKEFWAFMAFHACVGYAYRTGRIPDATVERTDWSISWADMGVISSLTTFFEVFYTGQSYGRFCHQYGKVKSLMATVCDFSFECTCHITAAAPQHVRLATRYFLASVVLFFKEVEHHTQGEEMAELESSDLILEHELEWLLGYSVKQRSILMMHWSAKITRDGFVLFENSFENPKRIPKNAQVDALNNLSKARDLMQDIIDTVRLPLPFQYFHLLNMMIVVNLILWGYGMALTHSIFGPLVYFFAATIFIGMMELSSQLSDPFGTDVCDFPIDEWLDDLVRQVHTVIEVDGGGCPFGDWKKALSSTPLIQADSIDASIMEDSDLESEYESKTAASRTSSTMSTNARMMQRTPLREAAPR